MDDNATSGQPLKMHCTLKETIMKAWMTLVIAATALTAGIAQASDVSWTITVGSPRPAPRVVYAPPPVVYAPPPVAYYPVYHPAPVVVQPVYQPVVYAQPVQYIQRIPPGHLKKWHKHGYKYGYAQGYRYGRHDD